MNKKNKFSERHGFANIFAIIAAVLVLSSIGYLAVSKKLKPITPSAFQSPTSSVFQNPKENGVFCRPDMMECPDGSYVGRTGSNCEFVECPVVQKDISDWKTYRSEKFGFEIKHPESWKVESGADEVFLTDSVPVNDGDSGNNIHSVFIFVNPAGTSTLESLAEMENSSGDSGCAMEMFDIGGMRQILDCEGPMGSAWIELINNDKIYMIKSGNRDILSTFKFTK